MKELKESDLQIGDILIFEDFNFEYGKLWKHFKKDGLKGIFYYLLHYLIAWFDPGKEGDQYRNIYHAAVWGNVDVNRDNNGLPSFENCVVQAGISGIGCASFEDTMSHETVMNVYVCRKKNQPESFEQDINNSVRNFYKEIGSYSFETAWLLAVICSSRYSSGTIYKILEAKYGKRKAKFIVSSILELINKYNNGHQRDMVACSVLVAMIYKNAGYELPVNVFEAINSELPSPKFDLDELDENELMQAVNAETLGDWPTLKETVVTPRQLMESPDVEVVGVLRHIK